MPEANEVKNRFSEMVRTEFKGWEIPRRGNSRFTKEGGTGKRF